MISRFTHIIIIMFIQNYCCAVVGMAFIITDVIVVGIFAVVVGIVGDVDSIIIITDLKTL